MIDGAIYGKCVLAGQRLMPLGKFDFSADQRAEACSYCRQYVGRPFRYGAVTEDEWLWLYFTCLRRAPVRILEIGTLVYTSSLAFLRAMQEQLVHSTLWSIDLHHRAKDRFGLTDPSVLSRWIRIIGASREVMPHLRTTFDLVFVDGDHTYDNVVKDFENALHLLSPGGIIIFHDSEGVGRNRDGRQSVRRAILSLKSTEDFDWYPGAFPGRIKGLAVYRSAEADLCSRTVELAIR